MVTVGTELWVKKEDLYAFLENTKQDQYNLWPGVTEKGSVDLLFDEICKLNDSNIIKAFHNHELISLLIFEDLQWDTIHFGFKCLRIRHLLTKKTSDKNVIGECLEKSLAIFKKYCVNNDIRFASADIACQDITKSLVLQEAGFKFILTWIDGLKKSTKAINISEDLMVDEIRPNEVDFFAKMAAKHYFKGGRFYSDPYFDEGSVNRMYGKLVQSSYENNEILLAYRIKEKPVGLFTCKTITEYEQFTNLRVAPLRFLIVDPRSRNKKIAQNLFTKTIEYLSNKSDIITTGLEIQNLPSLNLHSKMGFKFNYTHNVYHLWNL